MEFPPDLPPIVYVPAEDTSVPKDEFRVEYRTTKDNRKALLIYSAMDRLIRGMGPFQPWFVCQIGDLEEIQRVDGFDVVYLDIEVPEEHQRKPVTS